MTIKNLFKKKFKNEIFTENLKNEEEKINYEFMCEKERKTLLISIASSLTDKELNDILDKRREKMTVEAKESRKFYDSNMSLLDCNSITTLKNIKTGFYFEVNITTEGYRDNLQFHCHIGYNSLREPLFLNSCEELEAGDYIFKDCVIITEPINPEHENIKILKSITSLAVLKKYTTSLEI